MTGVYLSENESDEPVNEPTATEKTRNANRPPETGRLYMPQDFDVAQAMAKVIAAQVEECALLRQSIRLLTEVGADQTSMLEELNKQVAGLKWKLAEVAEKVS
jgi:hypothetical protein